MFSLTSAFSNQLSELTNKHNYCNFLSSLSTYFGNNILLPLLEYNPTLPEFVKLIFNHSYFTLDKDLLIDFLVEKVAKNEMSYLKKLVPTIVNYKDSDDNTILHLAAMRNELSLIKALLSPYNQKYFDVSSVNNEGKTMFAYLNLYEYLHLNKYSHPTKYLKLEKFLDIKKYLFDKYIDIDTWFIGNQAEYSDFIMHAYSDKQLSNYWSYLTYNRPELEARTNFLKLVSNSALSAEDFLNKLNEQFSLELSLVTNNEVQYQNILRTKCNLILLLNDNNIISDSAACFNELEKRPDLDNNYIFLNKVKLPEHIAAKSLAEKGNHHSENPIIQSLLQSIYSKIETNENLGEIFEGLYNKHAILRDVLTVAAKYIKDAPLFLVNSIKEDFNPASNALGYYSFVAPITIVAGQCSQFNNKECLGTLIHELSHMILDRVFKNNSNPYFADANEGRAANIQTYEEAILKILTNIANQFGETRQEEGFATNHHTLGKHLWNAYCNSKECENGYHNVLSSYNIGYTEDKYNLELIVRLPQVLAMEDNLDIPIFEALKPLQDYWEEFISPELQAEFGDNF